MADILAHSYNRRRRRVLTINDLADDDLLAIFDFYVVKLPVAVLLAFCDHSTKRKIESWQTLIHVCRRWRVLVFESPSHLNLQLCFLRGTSAKISLDIWPALPLLILGAFSGEASVNKVVAKLKHNDRIHQIQINLNQYRKQVKVKHLWTAMQVPFPKLDVLYLSFGDWWQHGPILPDSFLGGSAPRLRYLTLSSISFPGLPTFLLSTTHLVYLCLSRIPHSGYISPEAMATCLSVLTSLESFQLEFEDRRSFPDHQLPPPPTLSVLPALTKFRFKGLNMYFEGLVSRIDAPRLNQLLTTFFDESGFNLPELKQLIGRTPKFWEYSEAHLTFSHHEARVRLQSHDEQSDFEMVEVKIPFHARHWQFSSLAQICTSSLHPLLTVENLYIYENVSLQPVWTGNIDDAVWLGLLLPFGAVKNLYLSKKFAPRIAPALQELTGERMTEVLPALQNIFVEKFRRSEPAQEGIERFISARQFTNYPVTISVWDR